MNPCDHSTGAEATAITSCHSDINIAAFVESFTGYTDASVSASRVRANTWARIQRATVSVALRRVGLTLPAPTQPASVDSSVDCIIDHALVSVLSAYVRRVRPRLSDFVELWRCQTPVDYRPNKDIYPPLIRHTCSGYPHLDRLLDYATNGVEIKLNTPIHPQHEHPMNHGSAAERLPVLLRNLRSEQDAGRILIFEDDILEIWPEIFISPYGVVAKAGADPSISGRTIHDLSFPEDASINDHTSRDELADIAYQPCTEVVQEILRHRESSPSCTPVIMAGDVDAAFRHVGIHSRSVHLFGARIPELGIIVIDLYCPFGWTGSPSCYEVFGGAISHIHHNTPSPYAVPNFPYHWVDDHVCVSSPEPLQCAFV